MRPVIAIVMAVAILGSVQGYMSFQRAAARPKQASAPDVQRKANYQLRLTTSFSAVADPFQLYPAAVEIRRVGEDEPILRYANPVTAHETCQADVYMPSGASRLIVEAQPPTTGSVSADPDKPLTINLEFYSPESDSTPTASVTITLRRDWQRLMGEAEIKLP